MVLDDAGNEMQLQVGPVERGIRSHEGAALGARRGGQSVACPPPFQQVPDELQQPHRAETEKIGVARPPGHDEIEMILEVAADAGQLMQHADAMDGELIGRADAGQLQQLRRAERAGRQDDLAQG